MAAIAFFLIAMAAYMLLVATVGLLAGALANHWARSRRFAPGLRVGVPALFGCFGLLVAASGLGGGAVNPNTTAKLALIDQRFSELVACAPFAVSASVVSIAAGLWLAVRQLRRLSAPANR